VSCGNAQQQPVLPGPSSRRPAPAASRSARARYAPGPRQALGGGCFPAGLQQSKGHREIVLISGQAAVHGRGGCVHGRCADSRRRILGQCGPGQPSDAGNGLPGAARGRAHPQERQQPVRQLRVRRAARRQAGTEKQSEPRPQATAYRSTASSPPRPPPSQGLNGATDTRWGAGTEHGTALFRHAKGGAGRNTQAVLI
jgi:hypothetical protein